MIHEVKKSVALCRHFESDPSVNLSVFRCFNEEFFMSVFWKKQAGFNVDLFLRLIVGATLKITDKHMGQLYSELEMIC